jgi:hypothetical protein
VALARRLVDGRIWAAILRLMDRLTTFGLFAVTAMVICYALEDRSRWYVPGFAGACVLSSVYGFLQGVWPFGLVEGVWSVIALRRWLQLGQPEKGGCGCGSQRGHGGGGGGSVGLEVNGEARSAGG